MFRLLLGGDVVLTDRVEVMLRTHGPSAVWGDLLPLFQAVDLSIINLECPLTDHRQMWRRTPKMFRFRGDPLSVVALQIAQIDACSLANNHILDYEEQGLIDTIAVLQTAGLQVAGAGLNRKAAARPALLTTRGLYKERVALIAYTDHERPFAAGKKQPGTNYLGTHLRDAELHSINRAVRSARAAGALTVIVSMHWGPGLCERPSTLFRDFAHAVIDLGVDVFFGHGAHNFQGVEIYREKPILYGIGDLLTDFGVDFQFRNDWGFIAVLSEEAGSLRRLQLVPLQLSSGVVQVAGRKEIDSVLERMQQFSGELGTTLSRISGHLLYQGCHEAPTSRSRQSSTATALSTKAVQRLS